METGKIIVGNDEGFDDAVGKFDEEAVGSLTGGVSNLMVGTIVSGLIDGTCVLFGDIVNNIVGALLLKILVG